MSLLPEELPWELLASYFADELTAIQRADVEAWIAAVPDRMTFVEEMHRVWQTSGTLGQRFDATTGLSRLKTSITHDRPKSVARGSLRERARSVNHATRRVHTRRPWLWAAIAASVLAMAAWTVARFVISRNTNASGAMLAHGTLQTRDIITHRGQRAAFTLADGSRVILDAGSRLRIPADFGRAGAARELTLEGQAYFDVHHDAARPFRVRTAQSVAEDVGTAFVVTAFPETRTSTVAVESGIVALREADSGATRPVLLTLGRGDVGHIAVTGTATMTREANIPLYTAWTTGTYIFNNSRLGDAVAQLARWYDITITLDDPALAERRFTATFRQDEPVAQVLRALGSTLDIQVAQRERIITLSAGPSRSR